MRGTEMKRMRQRWDVLWFCIESNLRASTQGHIAVVIANTRGAN